jgi:enoyl-CoA hydratase/carnithine racemase
MDAPAAEPLRAEWAADVLTIRIDTPGCDVNIFSHRAAVQLVEILDGVDPDAVRAIVLRSDKPGSFVNGVGLMLANAVQAPEDVARLTEPVRRAYQKLADAPVPTIAALQGNCFGCGVELSLMCDYRVAQRSWDTQLYMTEIADYLFVPCFGGTQNLPQLLGLRAATELLLWGHRWWAPEAHQRGLVDAVFEPAGFDEGLRTFLDGVLEGERVPRPRHARYGPEDEAFSTLTRRHIDALAERYRPVYLECFELMETAARAESAGEAHHEREMLASGRSVMGPDSKNAQSFFFVRQLARRMTVRGAPPTSKPRLVLQDMPSFEAELRSRRILDLEVASADDVQDGDGLVVGPYGDHGRVDAVMAFVPVRAAIDWGPGTVLYAPYHAQGVDLVEVALRDEGRAVAAAQLAEALARAGFEPVMSRPDRRFAVDSLVDAYFAPLHAHVEAGGTPAEIDASLRHFGFTRGPAALAALVPEHSGARLFAAGELPAAEPHGPVVDAVLLSLLHFAIVARRKQVLGHPSLVDLLSRELLGFPLAEGSLCRHLSPPQVGVLLERADQVAPLVGAPVLETAREYHGQGQGFYR